MVALEVGWLVRPDCDTVDTLARLQLAAHRSGVSLRLQGACRELCDLIELAGLSEVLPSSGVEPGGQSEEREPARGIQEEGDARDPVA